MGYKVIENSLSMRLLILALLPFSPALCTLHSHEETPDKLPSQWFQERGHPVHRLFTRADDNSTEIGSTQWSAGFPTDASTTTMPKAWTDALAAAVAAGKIPDIPKTTTVNGLPTYPSGNNPNSPSICSSTYQCRIDGDIWDAPDGKYGLGFDDGPLPPTDKLVPFLIQNNQSATHFLIGTNILYYPDQFKAILAAGNDVAVHTWTHPYLTTLSNEQIVAEFGWTMQLIYNSTGKAPRFYRPPYGDSDVRVRGIALEVFGLEVIIWNQDTADWSLTTGGTTAKAVNASLTKWLEGPKSPGLIVLEHELSNNSVQAFMDAYPLMKTNGWGVESVVQLQTNSQYKEGILASASVNPMSPATASSGSTSSTGTHTASASTSSVSNSSSTTSKTSGSNSLKRIPAAALCLTILSGFALL